LASCAALRVGFCSESLSESDELDEESSEDALPASLLEEHEEDCDAELLLSESDSTGVDGRDMEPKDGVEGDDEDSSSPAGAAASAVATSEASTSVFTASCPPA